MYCFGSSVPATVGAFVAGAALFGVVPPDPAPPQAASSTASASRLTRVLVITTS